MPVAGRVGGEVVDARRGASAQVRPAVPGRGPVAGGGALREASPRGAGRSCGAARATHGPGGGGCREATWVGFRPGSARPARGVTSLPIFPPGTMSEGNAAGEPSNPGGPRPLLSGGRGLIGRRPAPPLTPGRLPSIRSRDLTLGGVKKVPASLFVQKPKYRELQAVGMQLLMFL